VPRYAFWITDHDSIIWPLPSPPKVGEVLDFGEPRGRWKVIGPKAVKVSIEAENFAVIQAVGEDGEPINDPLHPQQ
jgi:hypothetical protein